MCSAIASSRSCLAARRRARRKPLRAKAARHGACPASLASSGPSWRRPWVHPVRVTPCASWSRCCFQLSWLWSLRCRLVCVCCPWCCWSCSSSASASAARRKRRGTNDSPLIKVGPCLSWLLFLAWASEVQRRPPTTSRRPGGGPGSGGSSA
eukprot:5063080-Pyramimonas_sp.AAC.2